MYRDYNILIFFRIYINKKMIHEELLKEVDTIENGECFLKNNADSVLNNLDPKYFSWPSHITFDIELPDGTIVWS